MMKTLYLFLFLLFLLPAVHADAQEKSIDSMVRKVFAIVKSKDEDAFARLFPNRTQLIQLMLDAAPDNIKAQVEEQMKAKTAFQNDSVYHVEMNKELGSFFQKMQAQFEERGIDPAALLLTGYTIDSSRMDNMEVKNVRGVFSLQAGDTAYEMSFKDIIWSPTDRVWYGVELGRLRLKGEPEELEDNDSLDSVVVSSAEDDPPPPPPPPPPPKKAPVKKPAPKKPVQKTPPTRKPKT